MDVLMSHQESLEGTQSCNHTFEKKQDIAISVSHLYKTFPSRKGTIEALRGVNIAIPKGTIFGFLGPNGAGKTTTLRILTTLLPFDQGEAIVDGIHIQEHPEEVRKKIGYVSQQGGADRNATGWENLILQGRLYGLSKDACQRQANVLAETFSLTSCLHRLVSTYSGGQRRRLDIALGLMHNPRILFLDEPTNGLDPQNRDNLWAKIRQFKEDGITIFITSHYLDEIDALADTLAIMDHGQIVASGTPQELKSQISGDIITIGLRKEFHENAVALFEEEKARFREIVAEENRVRLYVDKGESAIPTILGLLDRAHIQLETIQLSVPSLNDVFLKRTGRSLREEVSL
jgi:ABC-2 type transport system ATP-binding protein